MTIWTKNEGERWQRWRRPGLGNGAVAIPCPGAIQVAILEMDAASEEQIIGAIHAARRAAKRPLEVIALSEHPTAVWYEMVRQAGADRVLCVSQFNDRRIDTGPPLEGAAEVGPLICPELHVKRENNLTLSVCGRRRDMMVLARHHFDCWCLADKAKCPHWQEQRSE